MAEWEKRKKQYTFDFNAYQELNNLVAELFQTKVRYEFMNEKLLINITENDKIGDLTIGSRRNGLIWIRADVNRISLDGSDRSVFMISYQFQ